MIMKTFHRVTVLNTFPSCWPVANEMVNIPSGKMLMGTSAADGKDGESPTKEVKIKSFKIDKYPVTNSDFR